MSASDELVLDPFAALLSGKQERKMDQPSAVQGCPADSE